MLDLGGGVIDLDVGERVGAAAIAHKHGVALGEIPSPFSALVDFDETAVGVLSSPGGDTLGDNGASSVFPDMNHLGACIGLLIIFGQGDGVKFADGIVPLENATGVFPGNRRSRFNLCPGDLGIGSAASASLGNEVVDPPLAVFVAWIPVLYCGVFNLGVIKSDQLYDRGMKLVFIAHRGGASLEIADVGVFICDDESSLKLPGVGRVDSEVGRELHGGANPFGDITKGSIAEDGGVQRSVEVVTVRNHRAQVFSHEIGVLAHRLRKRTEDDAKLRKFLLEGRRDGDAVKNSIYRDAREPLLFIEGYSKFVEGLKQLWINFVQALKFFFGLWAGVINNGLEVDLRIAHLGPPGLNHLQPMRIGFQPPLKKPLGLLLDRRYLFDDIFVEARRD